MPTAGAAAFSSMMERMAAFHTEREPLGVDREDLEETTARILHQTVTSQTAP